MRLLRFALLSLVALAACEPPPVVPTSDRRQNASYARIEGSVVVQSTARGNVVVLLYAAERPPPPQGSGRPVGFALIPAEQVFGDALVPPAGQTPSPGPFTASFAIDTVARGHYLVAGFIDADTCMLGASPCRSSDWVPWYSVTAEPNTRDVRGAAVDPLNPTSLRVFEVKEEAGALKPVEGLTVTFVDSPLTVVPLERPSFKVELLPTDPTSVLNVADPTKPKVVMLKPLAVNEGGVQTLPPAFMVRFEAIDPTTGRPVDANGDGYPEVWPKVLVRKLVDTPHSLTEENDLNNDGVLDAEGVEYTPMGGLEKDGQTDRVVLAAGFLPDVLGALLNPDGTAKLAADGRSPLVLPMTQLPLAIRPLALDARNLAKPVPLAEVPSGRYGITLVSFTGQTWRVPNELDPLIAANLALPQVTGQDFTIHVPLRR